jgi:hypothetical protein
LASANDIALVPNLGRTNLTRTFAAVANSLILHYALNKLIEGAPLGQVVGLLFARRYTPHPPTLGVMFDRGFATWDDPYGFRIDFAVPRQGCAIFLDRIAELRGGYETDAYVDESIYTAIHELGHVFNLVHNFAEPSFMAGSASEPRDHNFHRFTRADQLHLGRCSIDAEVAPAGAPFRDRDQSWSSVGKADESHNSNLSLSIEVARHRITPMDPLELDIRVRAPARGHKVTIPDEIDPGYPRFRIWIENPSGEKLLYRSPRHYCPSGATRILSPGESFERDVSVFGQSGRYTFRQPGEYKIWTELHISQRNTVRSNAVQLEILAPRKEWRNKTFLSEPRVARLLYYRCAAFRSNDLRKLREYRAEHGRDDNAGVIDYTIGRIHTDLAMRIVNKSSRSRHIKLAMSHLRRAADHRFVGRNARKKAYFLIEQLGG